MNIVAGGYGDYESKNVLDSVEVNVAGEDNWMPGSPLPIPLQGLLSAGALCKFCQPYKTNDSCCLCRGCHHTHIIVHF